jgi:hypothetical protein
MVRREEKEQERKKGGYQGINERKHNQNTKQRENQTIGKRKRA